MNITLTREELRGFQTALSEWYRKRFEFIITGSMGYLHTYDYIGQGGVIKDQIHKLGEQFEKENPKPDWRSLL